jgi:hypothetical protein
MKFKKNLNALIDRNRKLWTGNFRKGVLVKIDIDNFSTMRLWEEVLSPKSCPDYKKMFEVFYENFKKREFLLDDAMPTARPNLGDSAFGAFLGAEIQFGETGGYSKPFLKSLKDFKKIQFNKSNYWINWLKEATEYFALKSENIFATSIIETVDSLNFAESIFGSNIYLELYDHPMQLLEIFDFALEFNIKIIEEQRKYIKKYENGYFDLHEEWLPGNCIWLSIDSWGNCRNEFFTKFGKFHLQKIINYFGCGWLHMHNSHLHLLEEAATLKNLLGIGILDDPMVERCFKRLREIQSKANGIPLQINCEKKEFLQALNEGNLCRNVMYWIDSGVSSIEEANKIVEIVYDY